MSPDRSRQGTAVPGGHVIRPPAPATGAKQAAGQKSAILNALPAHIVRLDRQGTILAVNEAWKRLGVVPREDPTGGVGSNYLQLCEYAHDHFTDKALLVVRGVRAVLAGLLPEFFTEYACSSGGKHQWFRLIVTPMNIAGRPDGAVVMHVNVTSHKQVEQELAQSQKMEAIGQLAGGVAHDFNNLLCVITGYCDFLLKNLPAEDPLHSFSQEIAKASERAAGLTRQLLAFSRKQMLVIRTLNLNGLVHNTEKMLRRLIGEDIELVTALDPTLSPVRADPGQIEQILMNLAVNARDAMPQGGELCLSTANVVLGGAALRERPEVRPGSYVLLQVSDTGCGMDREVLGHLFEPFFTTKAPGKGTGLGLATVYGIVKQSDGHIEVESEAGRGTTFRIYLPSLEGSEEAAAGSEAAQHSRDTPGGQETVLLAEDEDGVRSLAREVLQQKGYTVLAACNGEEALSLSEKHAGPIDLLLTDIVMPKLAGWPLAQRLIGQRPGMKIVFMSGFTDSAMVRHGVAMGEVECLLKPFTPDALAEMVRRVLDEPGHPPGGGSPRTKVGRC
jgi:two-component system cell cycle sensor histidine kinase/response regulator CckA